MKKIILLILDGFGIRQNENGNAIKMSNLPNINKIMSEYPKSELTTGGEDVGLPKGVCGNSEVGHMTIGCGRTIIQPYTMINNSIKDKSFFENDKLLDMMDHVKNNKSTLHLIGLFSMNSNHSSMDHFYALLALAKIRGINNVILHFITDGKDSDLFNAKEYINGFMTKIEKLGIGTIGTLCGRYYAMDNDGNYDRLNKAYDLYVHNVGNTFADYARCLDLHYKNNITDEYVNPSVITKGSNIKDNDGVLFVDFRPERIDELITALTDESFNKFNTKKLNNVKYCALYSTSNKIDGAFTNETISNSFGKYLADLGFRQARIAEATKYPHVTYFFDGAEEFSDKNMYKILVPSAKVARFDMKPEMNIAEVTSAVLGAIEEDLDFVLVNFANPDMVGHTGNIPATVRALEAVDVCIEKILERASENFCDLVITSDHGNVELMKNDDGTINPSHTDSNVPFIICNKDYKLKEYGTLRDVIPTIIDMFEISKPKEMTGESLLIK
jgi:2,3-bisphosphoglycerate-independent phosphoglycerate mutase